ncbi:MAG TPA: imidazolonepropionase, partial [Thermoanaerobaculia bacterium]
MTSLDIRGAASLATPIGSAARTGRAQGDIRRIRHPAVRAEDGVLVFVGTEADYRREYSARPADVTVDAAGGTILPGLVDAHTHPVWTGDRGEEIGRRLAGESYAAIAAEGGGILATVA